MRFRINQCQFSHRVKAETYLGNSIIQSGSAMKKDLHEELPVLRFLEEVVF